MRSCIKCIFPSRFLGNPAFDSRNHLSVLNNEVILSNEVIIKSEVMIILTPYGLVAYTITPNRTSFSFPIPGGMVSSVVVDLFDTRGFSRTEGRYHAGKAFELDFIFNFYYLFSSHSMNDVSLNTEFLVM